MVKKTQELAKAHGWVMVRQFENEANPDYHWRAAAGKILDEFAGERLDYWVTGFGTGGTLKGVSRVLRKEKPNTKIIVCEPGRRAVQTPALNDDFRMKAGGACRYGGRTCRIAVPVRVAAPVQRNAPPQ